jgi:VIT1/CCC1 family predicted Fe2+/Mn2+ transporter
MTHHHVEPHGANAGSQLNWLRAAVLGANDGVTSVASIVVGIAGAIADVRTILIGGVAGLLAGAFSMAAGEYVSVSSQRDVELALIEKEKGELRDLPEAELAELTGIYEKKGLSRATAAAVARELTAHDALKAHLEAELNIDPSALTSPWQAAVASLLAFTAGGVIPLLSVLLAPASWHVPATFAAVVVALVVTGVLSAWMSGSGYLRVVARVVLGGLVAMAITYGVGRLFGVAGI